MRKRKTRLLVNAVVGLLLSSTSLHGQMPSLGFTQPGTGEDEDERALAPNNPWLVAGAQLGYKISGNSEFAQDFLVSTRLASQWLEFRGQSPRFRLPLIGNLSRLTSEISSDTTAQIFQKIVNTAEGMHLGFYPYYEFIDRSGDNPPQVQLTLFGSAGWKLNAGKDRTDSSTVYLNQGRFSMGLGVDFHIAKNNPMPLSLSVEPVLTIIERDALRRVTGESDDRIPSLEVTGVLPLVNDVGLMGQITGIDGARPLWRIGVIFVPRSTATDEEEEDPQDAEPSGVPSLKVQGRVMDNNGQPVPNGTTVTIRAVTAGVKSGETCTGDDEETFTVNTEDGRFEKTVNFEGKAPVDSCFEVRIGTAPNLVTRAQSRQAPLVAKPADIRILNFGDIGLPTQ